MGVRHFAYWMDGWELQARRCVWDYHARWRRIQIGYGIYEVEEMEKVVVAKKTKRASRMNGEGLTSGRVKKYKMILGMSNIERVEAGRTCSV